LANRKRAGVTPWIRSQLKPPARNFYAPLRKTEMDIQGIQGEDSDDTATGANLRKIRQIFDLPNSKFSELYYPSEQMAVDKVIVSSKARSFFGNIFQRSTKDLE
jgi:hypothetical protein